MTSFDHFTTSRTLYRSVTGMGNPAVGCISLRQNQHQLEDRPWNKVSGKAHLAYAFNCAWVEPIAYRLAYGA